MTPKPKAQRLSEQIPHGSRLETTTSSIGKERRAVTLCLAAAAETGKYAVVCCDGRLVYGNEAADVNAPKLMWFGDWLIMCAGKLSSTELVVEQIRMESLKPMAAKAFSREHIQETVIRAFERRIARWSALRHLSMYGMGMDEFRKNGRKIFGKVVHSQLARVIYNDAKKNCDDELAVVGWGKSPLSVLIFSVSLEGDSSHAKDASCAIGSGRDKAIAALFRLKQGLYSSLQDAIYCVAAAKFAAESKTVGKDTSLWIQWKRRPTDKAGPPTIPVQPELVGKLRDIWKKNRHPGIPDEARSLLSPIVELTKDEDVIARGSQQRMFNGLAKATRLSAARRSKRAR